MKYPKKATYGHRGHKHSEETKRRIALKKKGVKHTVETRMKISKAVGTGANNSHWEGGKTSINGMIRGSIEYRLWREAVFTRDNYTCIWCGKRGVKLNADHIKPFAYYPELRFSIDNGRTLCEDCHATTDSFKGRARKNYKHNLKLS